MRKYIKKREANKNIKKENRKKIKIDITKANDKRKLR